MVEIYQKKWFLSILLIVLFLIAGLFLFKKTIYFFYLQVLIPGYTTHLSVNELCELQHKKVIILDTRSFDEYQVSHIKGAQWVGYEEFTLDKIDNYARDTTVVLYCSVGYRSDIVGKKLQEAGFQHVCNLWGGIFAWVNEEHQVYQNNKLTKKVHAYSNAWGFWLTKGEKVLDTK